jgi:hypothetical protein
MCFGGCGYGRGCLQDRMDPGTHVQDYDNDIEILTRTVAMYLAHLPALEATDRILPAVIRAVVRKVSLRMNNERACLPRHDQQGPRVLGGGGPVSNTMHGWQQIKELSGIPNSFGPSQSGSSSASCRTRY